MASILLSVFSFPKSWFPHRRDYCFAVLLLDFAVPRVRVIFQSRAISRLQFPTQFTMFILILVIQAIWLAKKTELLSHGLKFCRTAFHFSRSFSTHFCQYCTCVVTLVHHYYYQTRQERSRFIHSAVQCIVTLSLPVPVILSNSSLLAWNYELLLLFYSFIQINNSWSSIIYHNISIYQSRTQTEQQQQ